MNIFSVIWRSLLYHGRLNLAVALGVAASTAVLAGALLVGDSVRYSLRALAVDQLGEVEQILVADRFFRQDLAQETAQNSSVAKDYPCVVPAIMIDGSISAPDAKTRAGHVSIIGCERSFWELESSSRKPNKNIPPNFDQGIVLNRPLADELRVKAGDEVILRFRRASNVPPDSLLGKKTETVDSLRITVAAVIPAEGLGRFGVRPNQQLPRNAFVPLSILQKQLEQPGKINALFAARASSDEKKILSTDGDKILREGLTPQWADYGISVKEFRRGEQHFFQIQSSRMLLDEPFEEQAWKVFESQGARKVFTYLANNISLANEQKELAPEKTAAQKPTGIPYSTLAAFDFPEGGSLGAMLDREGKPIPPLKEDEMALNDWAADDLKAQVGDFINVTFFEPESTHGVTVERTEKLRLAAIVKLAGSADDPDLTPELPGVTDQLSMSDWNPPFEFHADRVRKKDEDYWDAHKATPKAFVSHALGRKWWGSRFGRATAIRIPAAEGLSVEAIQQRLHVDPLDLGFEFRSVKRLAIIASSGTTPFDGLFLGFSFFLMAAALLLVLLLFRLGIEQRAAEIGILRTVGFSPRQILAIYSGEGLLIACGGSLLGIALGVGYAAIMLHGLRTWWVAAVSTPFMSLDVTPRSLVIGYVVGVLVSWLAILWSIRSFRAVSIRRLLSWKGSDTAAIQSPDRSRKWRIAQWSCGVIALGLIGWGPTLRGEMQAGVFFGAGAMTLCTSILWLWDRLQRGSVGFSASGRNFGLSRLAAKNAARAPGRTVLTVSLVASASFLIAAISSFRQDPSLAEPTLNSGNGGYALFAESDLPIYQNLSTEKGRDELSFIESDKTLWDGVRIDAFRVRPGDDASCLNLYQPQQPRFLGVPPQMRQEAQGRFAWSGTAAKTPEEKQNPWRLLDKEITVTNDASDDAPVVPVVIDMNTAMYSLHLRGVGSQFVVDMGGGKKMTLQVVGLLSNSLLQGSLLISEKDFIKHFPEVSGYRLFLAEAPAAKVENVEKALEETLGDHGFDARRSGRVLADFLAVQNTYLSTFQSLGGLGLLLGTLGVAVVQLRNVLERRGELALMRAVGFRKMKLAILVLLENGVLLVSGLGLGCFSALMTVGPHFIFGDASIPWMFLAILLGAVFCSGILAGTVAIRAVLTAPLLSALREE